MAENPDQSFETETGIVNVERDVEPGSSDARPNTETASRHTSPRRRKQKGRHHQSPGGGAAWAPPWTPHELHSLEVYERSKTPSPPCGKYPRDSQYHETNQAVVRKREEDADQSTKDARRRHKHEGIVMRRAREIEKKSRLECERHIKMKKEFQARMKRQEIETKPEFRNRAEQEEALGLSPSSSSRPDAAQ